MITINKPSFVTCVWGYNISHIEAYNEFGDLCYIIDLDKPCNQFSFNLIINGNYEIFPSPENVYLSGKKNMIKEIVFPQFDWQIIGEPEIIYEPGNYIAITDLNKGITYLGDKFYAMPEFARIFTLYHEPGHYFYDSQENADLFALYHFCKQGFNPSSAFYTIKNYCVECAENEQRLRELHANILEYQC